MPSDDFRACVIGIVPQDQLDAVSNWAIGVHEGDLLMTAECDFKDTERLLNDIRRNTR